MGLAFPFPLHAEHAVLRSVCMLTECTREVNTPANLITAIITERGVFKPGRIAAQFRPAKSLRSRLKGMSKRDLHEKKSRP